MYSPQQACQNGCRQLRASSKELPAWMPPESVERFAELQTPGFILDYRHLLSATGCGGSSSAMNRSLHHEGAEFVRGQESSQALVLDGGGVVHASERLHGGRGILIGGE